MGRAIIAIALIGFAFWALRKLRRRIVTNLSRQAEPVFEKTVQCAQCGVYVSLQQAIKRNDRYYCGTGHLPG